MSYKLNAAEHQQLAELVEQHSLSNISSEILSVARPCIRFSTSAGISKPSIGSIGSSRCGGMPDLPRGVEYPTDEDGTHLTFIAQVNLADIDDSIILPHAGMLYFFLEMVDHDAPQTVLHCTEGLDTLETAKLVEVEFTEPNYQSEEAFPITFSRKISLPDGYDKWAQETVPRNSRDDYYRLLDVVGLWVKNGEIGQLLGYPHIRYEGDALADDEIMLIEYPFQRAAEWAGVGWHQFIMDRSALSACDFSDVHFKGYW